MSYCLCKSLSLDLQRSFANYVSYAARLPELTTLLCQKLGGLKQPSPKRPRLTNAATSQMTQKSGTAVDRLQARKPRRTLERVITDERSTSQRPPPSLSRSATEPTLPRLKREVSDTSLSSIPLNRVAMQKRYSQREVDLHAASKAAEDKLKKKAKIDHELQTAITALKKPNPRMAVKELVEDAEKRLAGSHSRSTISLNITVSCTDFGQNLSILSAIPSLKVCRSWQHLTGTDRTTHSSVYRVFLSQIHQLPLKN